MGAQDILLESGKSGELSAVLQTLSETEVNGEPKYSSQICRDIGKLVVCRTYANAVLELCHLIVAANELGGQSGRYEYFFWDSGVARSTSFHNYILLNLPDHETLLRADKHHIILTYPDGEFQIQYSRMAVLSALLEFLLTALGYIEIDTILQDMLAAPSRQQVSQSANALSKQLYHYLKEHLPTAQSQRKFRSILSYCDNDAERINDDLILKFWRDHALNEEMGIDFKTFESVFLAFLRFLQSLHAAQDLNALQNTSSIGSDYEAGEIDPKHISERLDVIDEPVSTLEELSKSPLNQVKFLNKQECTHLETLLNAGSIARRLPLSILRFDVFAWPQSRLTQALRRKASEADVQEIILDGPQENYQDRHTTYKDLLDHLDRTSKATLYALMQNRDTSLPLTDDLIKTCEAAYKGLSRKGFKEDLNDNPDLYEAFQLASPLLQRISQDVQDFVERLDGLPGWVQHFDSDKSFFADQFSRVYGGLS